MIKRARQRFNAEREEVIANLKAAIEQYPELAGKGSKRPTKAMIRKELGTLFDTSGAAKAWVFAFYAAYEGTIKGAADVALALVGVENFRFDDPRVQKYFADRPQRMAAGVTRETDKQIRATLAAGIAEGEGIDELTARVHSTFGSIAGYRAERIARTESIHAASFATEEAWVQSEVVEGKEWYTAKDELVCEFCADMDGTVIGLGFNFFNKGDVQEVGDGDSTSTLTHDFDDVSGPPDHNNCRCTLLPVLK